MNKTQAAEYQAKIIALRNELASYVGERQADHTISMAEDCLRSMCYREGGERWLKDIIHSLECALNGPTYTRLMQISPETESWGGFLSHDISLVPAPSLREQFAASRDT